MSSYNHFDCSWCGGPFNGRNCPGCSSVGSEDEFVYGSNPYSYNETPNFFNQPPQHQFETYSCELCGDSPHYGFDCQTRIPLVYEQDPCSNQNFSNDQSPYYSPSQPQQVDCCEFCGGPHFSSNCKIRNPLVYEPNPRNNYDFPSFDQPLQYHNQQFYCCEHCGGPHYESDCQTDLITYMIESKERFNKAEEQFNIIREQLKMDVENNLNHLQEMMNLIHSNQDPLVDLYHLEGSDKGDNKIDSLPKKPLDTLLMGDEVISTTPERKNNEFIKSSVDDLLPIPRELEVISVCDLECNMPITTHLPTTDVREEKVDIEDIEELERLLADDPVPVLKVFDEPLRNSDSISRSFDVTFSNPLFNFNDDYTLCYDNPIFDEEFEDISSLDPLESTLVINEYFLLVTPLPDPKQICLREVERFDHFSA
nr:NAC domain-containing protein [Tanacetum cinerariifolium]